MPRIQPIQVTQASEQTRPLLDAIQKKFGMVPNMLKTMALSHGTLSGYLAFNQALAGTLDSALREQISLTVAGANGCSYCAAAHTLFGENAGVDADELSANLRGESSDPRTQAALTFALAILNTRGHLNDDELNDVRAAGFSDDQIIETIALVSLNIFNNYFNEAIKTEVDFPAVELKTVAS